MHSRDTSNENDVACVYSSRRASLKINEDFAVVLERRKTQNLEFVAVPIQKLYGNLYMDYEGLLLNHGFKDVTNTEKFLHSLRRYRNNSKNYATMFQTKGKVMVDILSNLIPKFVDAIQQSYNFYELQVQSVYAVRSKETRQIIP